MVDLEPEKAYAIQKSLAGASILGQPQPSPAFSEGVHVTTGWDWHVSVGPSHFPPGLPPLSSYTLSSLLMLSPSAPLSVLQATWCVFEGGGQPGACQSCVHYTVHGGGLSVGVRAGRYGDCHCSRQVLGLSKTEPAQASPVLS